VIALITQPAPARSLKRRLYSILCFLPAVAFLAGHAQTLAPNSPPQAWVAAAGQHELHIIDEEGTFPVRYKLHRIDNKGDITRVVIETKQGTLGRTILRDGKPLSAEEDANERKRLKEILDDPSSWLKHQKRDEAARTYATDLIKLMPTAMLYTYAQGQPQPPDTSGQQIVLDFKPNPNFHPPNTVSELLTGIAGRMWIDARTQCLTRMEGHVTHAVNFGWGVLAHIYPGGTVAFTQTEVGDGRWLYSSLDENITIREMMVHTSVEKTKTNTYDLHLLPAPVDYREAIQTLLDMPVPH
jgi:hypothetical protein